MLFTFGKATDWLTKPLQGPLKEFLGNTVLDLAMAAGGLIISIIATGAWKSLPFLRNIAKEVEEKKAPFVVPADYFSREAEENLLLAMLEGDPRDVMLLTGPPSSGKTATIARVLQRREERKEVSKADDVPGSVTRTVAGASIYVNMRFGDFLGSIQMGCELSGQFRTYIESLSGIADAEVRRVLGKEDQVRIGVQVLKALKLTKRKPPEEVTRWIDSLKKSQVGCEGIETAVKKIEQILRRLRPGLGEGTKAQVDRAGGRQMLRISDTVEERLLPPVICIDAAEELMRWPDPASLATLLRFLVGISSERRQAHVVLVTSDAKMQTWLKEKVGSHLVTVQVLGDLPRPAAARYFEGARHARLGDAADDVMGDVSFDDVWAVAGGRIALMQRLLERGRASGRLRTALQAERAASKDRLSRALAGISKNDLDSLRNHVQNRSVSLEIENVEPLIKAGILRKTPWSELGTVNGDENHSEGSGLQFVFPADPFILAELLQESLKNGKKDFNDRQSISEKLPSVEGEKDGAENGRSRGRRKSFFEI